MSKFTLLLKSLVLVFALSCAAVAGAAEPVDINRADAKALATGLKGIGQSKADAIIAYRDEHGPFRSVDELDKVKGIGKKTIDANRDAMRAGTPPADTTAAPAPAPATKEH